MRSSLQSRRITPNGTARDGFKIDPAHAPECYLARDGRQEFIVYDGHQQRDRLGRRNAQGGVMWHAFTCNCVKCDAKLLVRQDVLMKFLSAGIQGE